MILAAANTLPVSSWSLMRDVLLLRDYNTRMVVLTVTVLGAAAGLVGCFLLLRRRALMSDALSHATLPGIVIAFMVMVHFGGDGKWLPGLLIGAAVTGLVGSLAVSLLVRMSRLRSDAALGIVLSVSFGLGIVLLKHAQTMPDGASAGLKTFIYGKTSSIIARDLWLVLVAAGIAAVATFALVKELTLLCFDEGFARTEGWPTGLLDTLLIGLLTLVTVIGLQAVGIVLVIALFIIPATATRFWTVRLSRMLMVAPAIGALSGWIGASISALTPDLPAGAVIVLTGTCFFALSLVFGTQGGLIVRSWRERAMRRNVGRQHVLRAFYELTVDQDHPHVTMTMLDAERGWSKRRVRSILKDVDREGLVHRVSRNAWALTPDGRLMAQRIVRNHRLWELYLIRHADIAPSHVDYAADQIEHVLGPAMIEELEAIVGDGDVPKSPHVLTGAAS